PRSRLAQRASLRVGRKSIAGAHPATHGTLTHLVRALAIDCRPIQPLPTPRSFRNALLRGKGEGSGADRDLREVDCRGKRGRRYGTAEVVTLRVITAEA